MVSSPLTTERRKIRFWADKRDPTDFWEVQQLIITVSCVDPTLDRSTRNCLHIFTLALTGVRSPIELVPVLSLQLCVCRIFSPNHPGPGAILVRYSAASPTPVSLASPGSDCLPAFSPTLFHHHLLARFGSGEQRLLFRLCFTLVFTYSQSRAHDLDQTGAIFSYSIIGRLVYTKGLRPLVVMRPNPLRAFCAIKGLLSSIWLLTSVGFPP